jgi:hypothetical protein
LLAFPHLVARDGISAVPRSISFAPGALGRP